MVLKGKTVLTDASRPARRGSLATKVVSTETATVGSRDHSLRALIGKAGLAVSSGVSEAFCAHEGDEWTTGPAEQTPNSPPEPDRADSAFSMRATAARRARLERPFGARTGGGGATGEIG